MATIKTSEAVPVPDSNKVKCDLSALSCVPPLCIQRELWLSIICVFALILHGTSTLVVFACYRLVYPYWTVTLAR